MSRRPAAELEGLAVPMGVAAATDDPVHPVEVGIEWVAAAPRAALRTVTLDEMGTDPAVLGAACLAALADVVAASSVRSLAAGDGPQLLHGRPKLAAASGRLRRWRLLWLLCLLSLLLAACSAAARSCAAIGSGSCTCSGVRTGIGVSPRRTTVSANAFRASAASAAIVSCGPLTTHRIIQR